MSLTYTSQNTDYMHPHKHMLALSCRLMLQDYKSEQIQEELT